MRFTEITTAICILAMLTIVHGVPDAIDIEGRALEYIRSSENYVDNGGFGEGVVDSRIGEDVSVVIVEYSTRHVGMLQMIGHFVSYVTINSTDLEVISCTTEETQIQIEPEVPGESSGEGDGDSSDGDTDDPGPGTEPGGVGEDYRLKISYTINMTILRMIYDLILLG